MNKIIISGNICRDVELKYYNDKKCVKNTIAVRRDYKNKEGNYDSDFLTFSVWNNQAEYLNNYGKKGDKIIISGKMQNNNYQNQNGDMVYSNDILVESIEVIARKNTDENDEEIKDSEDLLNDNPFEISDNDLPF